MARAYSQDLRDRVIEAVLKAGLSRRAAARRFGVSQASAIKWLQGVTREGRHHPIGTGGHRRSKLKPECDWLLSEIDKCPDLTLAALCARLEEQRKVKADPGMMSRFFKGEGISFKKNRLRQRTGSA